MFTYILLILSIIVIFLWRPASEQMTNADVAKKVQFHTSKPSKWDMTPPQSTHQKADQTGDQVYGPKIPDPSKDEPKPAPPAKGHGTDVDYVYPTVLGPEQLKALNNPSETTQEYDFMPAAEFPAGPSEPMPFLSDFSKILNA
jgi:hypothetical protein